MADILMIDTFPESTEANYESLSITLIIVN